MNRPRLLSLAYRMLGSWAEAEDVVQEAALRLERQAPGVISDAEAWLERVVANLSLDVLKESRVKREQYIGPWLPEPVLTDQPNWTSEPFDPRALSLAFLALLERLSPLERAVYILAEAFDYRHEEIAQALGREVPAIRQLLHRAREHIREGRIRFAPDKSTHQALLAAFGSACSRGEVAEIEGMLARDAVLQSDGGGKAKAALNPIRGASAVARFIVGAMKKAPVPLRYDMREVNGWPCIVAYQGETPVTVLDIETDGQKVFNLLAVVNPEKLQALRKADL